MKSLVISTVFHDLESDSAKEFRRDLSEFISLQKERQKIILDGLLPSRLARTTQEKKHLKEKIAKEVELNYVEVHGIMRILKFFLNRMLDSDVPNEDYEKWADDLKEVSVLNGPEEIKTFNELIEDIQIIALEQVDPEVKRRKTAQTSGPTLDSFSISIGLLPVNEEEYEMFSSSDEYAPNLIDTVVFATMKMSFNKGPLKNIFFNTEEADIDMMINVLRAAEKDMSALRKFLKI